MNRKPWGRALISLTALVTAVGPYRADWNETHVHNPAWPPHAKFHNGQTMSLGLTLGTTSLWQLWRRPTRAGLDAGAVLASLYWVTQISALAYPGAKAVDPPGTERFPQAKIAFPALAVTALGYLLERRRLARG
ncbi:acetyltransferase [Streptomyces sp. MN03-5084-2B]|nr:acetyltransferase [Streptomyces sp. MN03-5084-2B]